MSDDVVERVEARLASPKLTPMMRQYLTVKSEHPHALVFFRMGDFFETFFEDAEEAARRLDIALTARSKEKDVPMAGVPHHALDSYLARLIQQGCTVVIVDQVEDPKQAKGLVRREITRIVTPGTFVDPDAPPRVSNYLVSVELPKKKRRKEPRWALAALDLSTGEFRATSGDDESALVDELLRLSTREILIGEDQSEDPLVASIRGSLPEALLTEVDPREHGGDLAVEALGRFLGSEERDALKVLLPRTALIAAGRALGYARQTQARTDAPDLRGPVGLGHVESLKPYVPGAAVVLDREARDHLELFRSSQGERRGSLLHAIDRAVTAGGGRLLARWLTYPPRDQDEVRARHAAVQALLQSPSVLDSLRAGLEVVSDVERLLGRVVLGRAGPLDLRQLATSLAGAPLLFDLVEQASRGSSLLEEDGGDARLASIASVDPCSDVGAQLAQALVDQPSNDLAGPSVFRPGYDAELDRTTKLSSEGRALMEALEKREKEATGIPSLKVRDNKVFGFYIEVTKPNLSLVPERYIRKQTTVNAERFFSEELKELEEDLSDAEERRAARTETLFRELLSSVTSQAPRLRQLAEALSELDVLCALARIAEEQDWIRPQMDQGFEIDIEEGRHPVLEPLAGQLGERFVANDLRLSEDERLMIITGPNMAGKSTIMRQTALIVILAYMGSFVPARRARIGRVDRVFTRVGAGDDLSRGRSTFMVEMTETSRILRSATEHDLVILDEVGRGTSTFDGLSIAWAVAEYLHDVVRARTLFATHYHELTELSRDKPQAVNRHVAVREHEEDIVFLRKLQPGPTNRSYGVQVARLAGLPASVVSRARDVLDGLEAQSLHAKTGSLPPTTPAGRTAPSGSTRNQLPLFAPASPSAPVDPGLRQLMDRLREVDIDDLSPRRALDLVAELKGLMDPRRP